MRPQTIISYRVFDLCEWWVLVYPSLVLLGFFISVIVGDEELRREIKKWYWIGDRNVINRLFAYQGKYIFDVGLAIIMLLQVFVTKRYNEALLPSNARDQQESGKRVASVVASYFVKWVLVYLILWLCFLFIDHVFVWSGGSCSVSDTKSAEECRSLNGVWKGGFDISGHFCFLTNLSLVLWNEMRLVMGKADRNSVSWTKICIVGQWVVLAILVVWTNVLLVTSIYYHTFLEKVLGCAFGYTCFIVLYMLLPQVKPLNKIFT